MKDIFTNKDKVPNEAISTMLANYSFSGKILEKLGDPGIPTCKAPDVVLTLTSRFRVRSELEAHQVPPAHDTRTRVAAGFSTTGIQSINSTRQKYIRDK